MKQIRMLSGFSLFACFAVLAAPAFAYQPSHPLKGPDKITRPLPSEPSEPSEPSAPMAPTASVTLPAGTYAFTTLATTDGGIDPSIYEVSGSLTLESGATIQYDDNTTNCPFGGGNFSACPISIQVTGDLLMKAGSVIKAENLVTGGSGGDITIDVDGDMVMCGPAGAGPGCGGPSGFNGALISSRKLSGAGDTGRGGDISITVGDLGTVTGSLLMEGGPAETGAKIQSNSPGQAGDIGIVVGGEITIEVGAVVEAVGSTTLGQGGRIIIISGCDLTQAGRVTSAGQDPGADLVHLEACEVTITGLVESTGPGHTVGVTNSCTPPNRPGKPANSRACIDVWGMSVTIDASGTNSGELNADVGMSGGTFGTSWIDVYAHDNLTITGDSTGAYAVHANGLGGTNDEGGTVTVKSIFGRVGLGGLALQANANGNPPGNPNNGSGGKGGTVLIEASGASPSGEVSLGTSSVQARGKTTGGAPKGGTISARSYNDDVLGSAPGELNASGGPPLGSVTLEACGAVTYTGTSTPAFVDPAGNPCGGTASVPMYVIFDEDRCALCGAPGDATKSGMKFNDLNGNGVKDLGEPGLEGWEIHIFNADLSVHQHTLTDAAGNYSFTIPPGSYTVCETQQPTWVQTFPNALSLPPAGADCSAHGGGYGWAVTLAAGDNDTGNDFGNNFQFCEKQPVRDVLNSAKGRFPGNLGLDAIVRVDLGQSVQAAVDAAALPAGDTNGDGYLLIGVVNNGTGTLGGSSTQSVVVGAAYSLPFGLIGCSVTLVDPTPGDGNSVIQITPGASSPANIFVMDLHAKGSTVAGILVEGNGRYLRNEDSSNNGTGFRFIGNGNTMHNGAATENTGVGVYVQGSSNILDSSDSYDNGSHGFHVVGDSNQILKVDTGDRNKGNLGDGVNVVGNSNLVSEVDAFSNAGDGLDLTGNDNQILKGKWGERGDKSNGGDGVHVAGYGNLLKEIKTAGNVGDGVDVSGGTLASPNSIAKDTSNTNSSGSSYENGGAEYLLQGYVKNYLGGNKADSTTVPKTSSPTKCPSFPATNATSNFAAAYVCE